MSEEMEPPEQREGVERETRPKLAERPVPVLTIPQHALVRHAREQRSIERAVRYVRPRFRRFLDEDLESIGKLSLYHAAKEYDDAAARGDNLRHDDFAVYAYYYARREMMKAVDDEMFEERVKIALTEGAGAWAIQHHAEYDSTKEDARAQRNRFRAFASGLLSATFLSGVEAAQKITNETQVAAREEYARAILGMKEALRKLDEIDRRMLLLVHGEEPKPLTEAAKEIGITYKVARVQYPRAMSRLRKILEALGIVRAPPPTDLDVPDDEETGARAPPDEHGRDPPQRKK